MGKKKNPFFFSHCKISLLCLRGYGLCLLGYLIGVSYWRILLRDIQDIFFLHNGLRKDNGIAISLLELLIIFEKVPWQWSFTLFQ